MALNSAAGLSGMLPAGTQHYENVYAANVAAVTELSSMLGTSLGPHGRHKLVVNHLNKRIVTSDCALILKELEVSHPAAKLLQQAAQAQSRDVGDGTNTVLVIGGALLQEIATLMEHSLSWQVAPEIRQGITVGLEILQTELAEIANTANQSVDWSTTEGIQQLVEPVVATKQYGHAQVLAKLVAEACRIANDSADSVRTVKLLGNKNQSFVVPGYVAQRAVESVQESHQQATVAVYACGIEASSTEAKGTVVMRNGQDLVDYNRSEEARLQELIQSIQACGVDMIVTGGNVSDLALHYIDQAGLICLRIGSKWELRRLCRAIGATALVRLGPPTPDELATDVVVETHEWSSTKVTVLQSPATTKLATIVLRAATRSTLDDWQAAVDQGVRVVQAARKDGRLVKGAGVTEERLAQALLQRAQQCAGLEQYSLVALSEALLSLPRMLEQNDINDDDEKAESTQVWDLYTTKLSALRLAVDAALTILQIDQIIMSKPAGMGSNAGGGGGM